SLEQANQVVIKVYDVFGKEVLEVTNSKVSEGNHQVVLNSQNLSSGIYFVTVTAGNFKETKRISLIKD
ncbi:MAG: T9SS type A sorting domain-containing protein, partial [Bacteroidetes bacterium]|nr:T9SS type A sorting domain-containing protein [Bacteroidota bacterium]